ncbi:MULTISPECIES: hypothetical protein [unclassified Sphingomonas]|uniref:hypothetical protein n=1 Tax=unclassified Sphingomonas TaxID=196159 RepID=UPI000A4FF54E|nr:MULTISPECIES: hypothetical protein [unclassified Sphingomonas]
MTDLTDTIALNTAIARLQDFIDTYPDGDMPLTKDDVLMVIEAAKRGAGVVEVKGIKQ